MRKLGKILLGIAAVVAVIFIGLSLFVRFYLTEDRLKALIIPPAEKALARNVSIGAIKVGLLKGITINDFSIKEADGRTNFVSADSFVLRYDLPALFKKQVIVNEAHLENPTIRIHRDQKGKFNFETLAVLQQTAEKPSSAAKAPAAALPLALTINQIHIQQARLELIDNLGELPATKAEADLKVAVKLGSDLASLQYQGELKLITDIVYGKIKPHISLKSGFDQNNIDYTADISIDDQKMRLNGQVRDYAEAPNIELNVNSDVLNLEYLAGLAAGLPKPMKAKQKKPAKTPPAAPIARSLPQGLLAQGRVNVEKALYKGLTIHNFTLHYTLRQGVLTVKDLAAKAGGGSITGGLEADLNKADISYNGEIDSQAVDVKQIRAALAPQSPDIIGGMLSTSLSFSGTGTEWAKIQKTLSADSTFDLSNGQIRNNEVTRTLANVLGLPELNDYSFETKGSKIKVENGNAVINSQMTGEQLSVETKGNVGLDGKLSLPLILRLSQALSDKLKQRASFVKYLAAEKGETVIRLNLTGTVNKPRATLDQAAVQKQVEKTIEKKVLEEVDRALGDKNSPATEAAKELLKGIFGR